MRLFVDASAAVAAFTLEEDADTYLAAMASADELLWSAIAQWECTVAVARRADKPVAAMIGEVARFADEVGIVMLPIGLQEMKIALEAQSRLGKGSGHPAQLNMGDCFAYACTKTSKAKLLYKGNDFSHTDLA